MRKIHVILVFNAYVNYELLIALSEEMKVQDFFNDIALEKNYMNI